MESKLFGWFLMLFECTPLVPDGWREKQKANRRKQDVFTFFSYIDYTVYILICKSSTTVGRHGLPKDEPPPIGQPKNQFVYKITNAHSSG